MPSPARNVARRLHLWLGLSFGLLFALLGLTGSALVFYQEIDGLLHPEVQSAAPALAPQPHMWDVALATVRAAYPHGGQWRFEVTDTPGPIAARFYPTGAANGHMTERIMVWLSPDGRHILRQAPWGGYAMSWIYELHMALLAGDAGLQIVGWSGMAIVALLLAGLAAWWPRREWGKAIAFKRRAAPIRRLRDLHKLTGLVALPLLLMFAITGFMLALPDTSNGLLSRVAGPVAVQPKTQSSASRERMPISLARALAIGRHAAPEGRVVWIEVPPPGQGVIRLRVQVPGDPSRRFPHSYIHIDQYNGAVLAVFDARRHGAATQINNWLHPLHDASIGGLATRILAFIVGLTPALLFATGLLRWNKRRSRRANPQRKVTS